MSIRQQIFRILSRIVTLLETMTIVAVHPKAGPATMNTIAEKTLKAISPLIE